MTNEKAIEIIKADCYVFNPLNMDRSTMINQALDRAVEALNERSNEMTDAEKREYIAMIKGKINSYEGSDEDGVVKGLLWASYLLEHGKDYADQRVKLNIPELRKLDGMEKRGCC